MPRPVRGSTYQTRTEGVGIRWPEAGQERRQTGFRTATDARRWFDENIAPRLRRRTPVPADMRFTDFCDDYLHRWGADVAPRTKRTIEDWLKPAREQFGGWRLSELEGAADDISRWRARIPSEDRRHKNMRALRQTLQAAKRWGYIARNPAVDAGPNHAPRAEEIQPFTPAEINLILEEVADSPRDIAIITLAADTGLRTNEWPALQRRDIDRRNPAVAVARRYASGQLTPYPKTRRRRVPLTPRAVQALEQLPARLDTTVLFPNRWGEPLNLNNWRGRVWYPALDAAGIPQRGPYHLRHTFATEALAAGVSIFQLSRLMGASVATIDRTYGHLAHDGEETVRALLAQRSRVVAGASDQTETEKR